MDTMPAPAPAEWRRGRDGEPVPVSRFGKDHWGVLAYIETCAVDRHGVLDPDRMRCSSRNHPVLLGLKRYGPVGDLDAVRYPSIVKADEPPVDGKYGRAKITDHDDFDCADDLVAAGMLIVTMPEVNGWGVYTDHTGKTIRIDGSPLRPATLTGLAELHLAAYARWSLTPYGQQVIAALRAWKANDGSYQDFVPPPPSA